MKRFFKNLFRPRQSFQEGSKMDCFTFEFFRKKLENIEHKLDEIIRKENHMATQLDDLNAAIAAEDVQIQDLITSVAKIDADIVALLAKIAAGGTMPDISAQLQAIQSHTAALATASQQLKDDDTKANA